MRVLVQPVTKFISRVIRLANCGCFSQDDVFFFHTSINGTVFQDANNDGVRQVGPNERGIGDTTVQLYDEDSKLIATVVTDISGVYQLRGQFDPASYTIVVTVPLLPSCKGETPPPKTHPVMFTRGGNVVVDFAIPAPTVTSGY